MKILHWTFIFLALIIPFSIICRNTVDSRFTALEDEVRINNAVDVATKDAIDQIIAVSGFNYDNEFGDVINITPKLAQESINTFFHSMAINYNIPYKTTDTTASLDKSSDSYIKNYFAAYVPAVIVLAYDGFYIYSQELTSAGYEYQLSSKIPYTYESPNGYTIGYTLGEDIYLYIDGECYSGRIQGNTLEEVRQAYKDDFEYEDAPTFTVDEIAMLTNNMSEILYYLDLKGKNIGNELLPVSSSTTEIPFLQDYEKLSDGSYSVGEFHKNRRKTIINIVSQCLSEEIAEHNRFADLLGSTYEFYLPEIPEDDWVNSIDDISIMAFVQGIPVGTLKGVYYNSYALGGSQIVRRDYYYGIPYTNGGTTTNLYHKKSCSLYDESKVTELFITEEDAYASGYKPCLLCN